MTESATTPFPEPGIYLHMDEAAYHAIPAFSKSLVKKFRISDIDAWESLYGEEQNTTPDMEYGTALHALLLEGREAFESRYCKGFSKADHPDALDTVDDLKKFLDGEGVTYPKSGAKPVLVDIVRGAFPETPMIDRLKANHEAESVGKQDLPAATYDEILSREWCRNVSFLQDAQVTEASLFWHDEQLGVPCKARIDSISFRKWRDGFECVVGDIKTFTNIRQKPIADAVAYEVGNRGYHIDGLFYTRAVKHAPRIFHDADGDVSWPDFDERSFELLFIEKGRRFPNVLPRPVSLRSGGGLTEIGQCALATIQDAANRYRDLHADKGTKPWNSVHREETITEADVPLFFL